MRIINGINIATSYMVVQRLQFALFYITLILIYLQSTDNINDLCGVPVSV